MRSLPYDSEAEDSIIGAMVLSSQAIDDARSSVAASDFYQPTRSALFDAIVKMREAGETVDAVSVRDAVRGFWNEDLGPDIVQMMTETPTVYGVKRWAQIVVDKATRRRLIGLMNEVGNQAYDPSADIYQALENVQAALATIESPALGEPDDISVEEFVERYRETDVKAKWTVYGLIRKQHKLMIVAGESHGKSVLMRYIAVCAAYGFHPFRHTRQKPIRTLLVDLENPSDALSESFEMILRRVVQESPQDETVNRLWWKPAGIDLRDRGDVARFESVIAARRPDLVCLGPMYQAYETKPSEHWETPARQVQRVLKELMVRYDFALILEDHAPQADSSGKRPMRPYGSSFWRRWLDLGIGLEPLDDTNKRFTVNMWKGRVGTDWPKVLERGDLYGPDSWPWIAKWDEEEF